jgi:hypothetical protein
MIYLNMITWSAYDHTSMLCVSKRMRAESQESFDLRRLQYPSQSIFVKRAQGFSLLVLDKTKEISICCEDIDVSRFSLVSKQLPRRLAGSDLGPYLGSVGPYQPELDLIYQTLTRFPNLRTFTVGTPRNNRASPARYLNQLFTWLGNNHRAIEGLGIGLACDMSVLLGFNQLRELSFSGYSTTSEHQSRIVFAQLHHLETLGIICQETSGRQRGATRIRPSAIASIKPLKHLSFREEYKYADENGSPYGIVYSEEICNAFEEAHHKSLESLNVTCRFQGGRSQLAHMRSLICSASSLKTLTLELHGFDATLLWQLPKSLESLNLSLRGQRLGVEQTYFKSLHAKLPLLERICFTLLPVITVMDGNVVKSREEKEVYKFETGDFGESRSAKWVAGWPK